MNNEEDYEQMMELIINYLNNSKNLPESIIKVMQYEKIQMKKINEIFNSEGFKKIYEGYEELKPGMTVNFDLPIRNINKEF